VAQLPLLGKEMLVVLVDGLLEIIILLVAVVELRQQGAMELLLHLGMVEMVQQVQYQVLQ
jgi:hypothetical protein